MSEELVKEAPGGVDESEELTEEESEDELVDLGELSLMDLEELLPSKCSLSLANMGERGWTVILRPIAGPPPKLVLPGYVPPSQTPIIAAGKTLSASVTLAFSMMAPDGLRCPQCGEFSMEKLGRVAGSDDWIECLSCGKKYAGSH